MGKQTAQKAGLDTLGMDELMAKAWRFVRERFRSYQTELKSRGMKRARARRDADRQRQDIVTLVKRQLTREISEGRFTASREAVKREVERRVKERMILSRNRNYSRLATASPESDLLRIIRHAPEAFARLKPASAQKISATYKKQPHHPPSGASGPLFLIQNTPHRRGILLIHIKLQGTSP